KSELKGLVEVERPELIRTVSWAAANGDRSENADYLYGKKRLREIERRIRFLMKRLEAAEVVDPRDQDQERVFFGATVRYADPGGREHTVSIVGTDEVDPARGRVSWISPVARADPLARGRHGDAADARRRGAARGAGNPLRRAELEPTRRAPERARPRLSRNPRP